MSVRLSSSYYSSPDGLFVPRLESLGVRKLRVVSIFGALAALALAGLYIEPETPQVWIISLLVIGGLIVPLIAWLPWPLPFVQRPAGTSVPPQRQGGVRHDTAPTQKTSVSGYNDILDQLEAARSIFNDINLFHLKRLFLIGFLPAISIFIVSYLLSFEFKATVTAVWITVSCIAYARFWIKPYQVRCPNPGCNAPLLSEMKGECPCSAENTSHILSSCAVCSRVHHAFVCPYCFEPMLVTEESLKWSKESTDRHTAIPIINGKPVVSRPRPSPRPPPPRPKPPPGPKVDPVIQMMNEYLKSSMQYRDFLAKTKEELRAKYRNDPSFVDETMEDLENKIREHREGQGR